MRIIAAICGREAKDAILECLGLPSRAPPTAEPTADDDPYGAWSAASRGLTSDHQPD